MGGIKKFKGRINRADRVITQEIKNYFEITE